MIKKGFIATLVIIAAFIGQMTFTPAGDEIATLEQSCASIDIGFNSAHAQTYQECIADGCSSSDCTTVASNSQFTCKSYKCFKSCFRGKGFSGSCYDYAGNQEKFDKCKEASDDCEMKCVD